MPDFSPYMQYPTLDAESLRGTLISLIHQEPALRARPPGELDRAVSDVIAGQLVPSSSRVTAYQQVIAGFVAVLLRLAGANPSSILNELNSRDVDDQLALMSNILMRMLPDPTAPGNQTLGENGNSNSAASHARMMNVGVNKHLAQSVEHAVPLRATPVGQRPPASEAMLVRLEVLPGVSVDIDESMQRFMRKPERRAEVMNEIAARLEKYFGG